jgi:putative membrane protein
VIALVVQLSVFGIVSLVLKGLSERIKREEMAAGVFVAAFSVAAGMLNAACMVPV